MEEMDEQTKKRYIAWKRKKILKRMLFLAACIFVLASGIILGVNWRDRDSNDDDVVIRTEPPTTDATGSDELVNATISTTEPSDNGEIREPIVFCGNRADPELATTLTNEQALSYLALVNRCYRVSAEFTPGDLSVVDVESVNLNWGPHHMLRETAARATEALFYAAASEGMILLLSSANRTNDNQTFYFNNNVDSRGLEEAMRVSAVPGHSEHQLGLAIDITTHELSGMLNQTFAETIEGIWVSQNAHYFGFIISFPQNREADTGFIYEPWHLRYVGVEVATFIFNNGLILEEYLWYYN